jgi:trehalose-6-phosphate synthase
MYKYFLLTLLLFSGCSNMTFNATMCDQIASDPNAVMPKECINYSEEEAQKAFYKTKDKVESKEDIVEFNKE